eukprot:5285235-Pleurochrysis_carterae.AAC.1
MSTATHETTTTAILAIPMVQATATIRRVTRPARTRSLPFRRFRRPTLVRLATPPRRTCSMKGPRESVLPRNAQSGLRTPSTRR